MVVLRPVARIEPLVRISRALAKRVDALEFSDPVTHVYNPLVYAREPHERYLKRFGAGPKEVIFFGMNPGPFGMAQSGVPFGDVGLVRDFLGIEGRVGKPPVEHPKRPVQGFDCPRSEVSGSRVWGWVRDRFGKPEPFFERFFIANYCPLVFMEDTGRNRTPDKLPKAERDPLLRACDDALRKVVEQLKPRFVVGIGGFAEKRAREALGEMTGFEMGAILHPSPASPKANRGWAPEAERDLKRLGIL